jgi:bifunctional UDP-N-acetylglucosamine pyrophosphorylase/glucosamine-1-phosphate N-acetyltransferase
MQARIQKQLRESGVTIVSGFNSYIESDASIGQDTVVQPFSFIGRGSSIGRECVIGPFAVVPRESIVPEGMTILRNVSEQAGM